MIKFEKELKKLQPCMEVDDAEGAIYRQDITDVIDILKEMIKYDNSTSDK